MALRKKRSVRDWLNKLIDHHPSLFSFMNFHSTSWSRCWSEYSRMAPQIGEISSIRLSLFRIKINISHCLKNKYLHEYSREKIHEYLRRLWNWIRIFLDIQSKKNKSDRKRDTVGTGTESNWFRRADDFRIFELFVLNLSRIWVNFFSTWILWDLRPHLRFAALGNFSHRRFGVSDSIKFEHFCNFTKKRFFDGSHRLFLNTSIHP